MMDAFLDILWIKIVDGVAILVGWMDRILAPLNVLGPEWIIFILALATVLFTKWFSRIYTTRRYESLKSEFQYWFNLRQEALSCPDREKGKLLAKNIDQAKLNRVYYDYFFEGLLKNILTTYLPALLMAAYVNEAYKPENLMITFNRDHLLPLIRGNGDPAGISALFCYIIFLLTLYLCWPLARRAFRRKHRLVNPQTVSAVDQSTG